MQYMTHPVERRQTSRAMSCKKGLQTFAIEIPKEGLTGLVPAKPSFGINMTKILHSSDGLATWKQNSMLSFLLWPYISNRNLSLFESTWKSVLSDTKQDFDLKENEFP